MRAFRPDLPPHVAAVVRALPPDLKASVKAAVRALSRNPELGEPLERELVGLWRYRVRRFRIVYEIDRLRRTLRIVAVGHRRDVYEDLAEALGGQSPVTRSGRGRATGKSRTLPRRAR